MLITNYASDSFITVLLFIAARFGCNATPNLRLRITKVNYYTIYFFVDWYTIQVKDNTTETGGGIALNRFKMYGQNLKKSECIYKSKLNCSNKCYLFHHWSEMVPLALNELAISCLKQK